MESTSFTATVVDFTVTILVKELLGKWYLLASVLGTVAGGIVNFLMNRSWVFKAGEKKIYYQAVKYLLVWTGNLLLVTGGVFLLTHYGEVEYKISKIITSLFVGFFYNYILQKRFVFK